ncbi:MAG TPA: MFS transporter, partial [Streptosporangiaceae bacterium]|nr:MFS transporter [Streptosporangiaceae bacterium]
WLVPGLTVLAAVMLVAGLAIAPTLIAGYGLVAEQAPAGRRTEGMTWLSSAISVGVATGSPIAGHLIDALGARWGYVFAAGCGGAAVLTCLAGLRRLRTRRAGHGGADSANVPPAAPPAASGRVNVSSPDRRAVRSDHESGRVPRRAGSGRARRPSLGGGRPAQDRELRAQGRQTVGRLLEAGLAEFDERGFQTVRVDDIVRRAQTSHGTFYLYFANKEDLFKALLADALDEMATITDAFPVVTRNAAGRAALRAWVRSFCKTYEAHSAVLRVLTQAELVGEDIYGDGLQLLFRLAEAMAQGMTAATGRPARPTEGDGTAAAAAGGTAAEGTGGGSARAELTSLACLLMLERVNYLLSVEVRLPRDEMVDRIAGIMYAAFAMPDVP